MPAGARFHVTVVGPKGEPEIAEDGDAITFWAWSGTSATVTHEGKELAGGAQNPSVPAPPSGKSVREFMEDTGLGEK